MRMLAAVVVAMAMAIPCTGQTSRREPAAVASAAHATPTMAEWQKIQKDYPAFAAAYRVQQATLITVTNQCSGVPVAKQSVCQLVHEGIIDATGVLGTYCGSVGGIRPPTNCALALARCLAHAWDDQSRDACQAAFDHCQQGTRRPASTPSRR